MCPFRTTVNGHVNCWQRSNAFHTISNSTQASAATLVRSFPISYTRPHATLMSLWCASNRREWCKWCKNGTNFHIIIENYLLKWLFGYTFSIIAPPSLHVHNGCGATAAQQVILRLPQPQSEPQPHPHVGSRGWFLLRCHFYFLKTSLFTHSFLLFAW